MSKSSEKSNQGRFAEEAADLVFRGRKSFGGYYKSLNLQSYEAWLKSVEGEGQGKQFEAALARYFLDEGERYAAHLLRVAGA